MVLTKEQKITITWGRKDTRLTTATGRVTRNRFQPRYSVIWGGRRADMV